MKMCAKLKIFTLVILIIVPIQCGQTYLDDAHSDHVMNLFDQYKDVCLESFNHDDIDDIVSVSKSCCKHLSEKFSKLGFICAVGENTDLSEHLTGLTVFLVSFTLNSTEFYIIIDIPDDISLALNNDPVPIDTDIKELEQEAKKIVEAAFTLSDNYHVINNEICNNLSRQYEKDGWLCVVGKRLEITQNMIGLTLHQMQFFVNNTTIKIVVSLAK